MNLRTPTALALVCLWIGAGCGDDGTVATEPDTSTIPTGVCRAVDSYSSGNNGTDPQTGGYTVLECPAELDQDATIEALLQSASADPASVRPEDDAWWLVTALGPSDVTIVVGPFTAFVQDATIDEGNAPAYLAERHPEAERANLWVVVEEAVG